MGEIFHDTRWEAYGLLLEAYYAVTRRINAEVSPDGDLDTALCDLVFRLARTPGHALRAVDITRALSTSTTRTTRILDEAETRNLIARRPHPADRRATLISLTGRGTELAHSRAVIALSAAQRHIHDILTPEEAGQMSRILRKLRDAAHPSATDPADHVPNQQRALSKQGPHVP